MADFDHVEAYLPDTQIINGEIVTSPYAVRAIRVGCDDIGIEGFSDDHSLSDIARWVIGKSREDAEELALLIMGMLQ